MEQRRGGGLTGAFIVLMFVGLGIALISLGQAFQVGGSTWLGVLVGVGVAVAAGGVLVAKPRSGGRR